MSLTAVWQPVRLQGWMIGPSVLPIEDDWWSDEERVARFRSHQDAYRGIK